MMEKFLHPEHSMLHYQTSIIAIMSVRMKISLWSVLQYLPYHSGNDITYRVWIYFYWITILPFLGFSSSHPSHVPQIVSILRKQAMLNTLLSSCVRLRSQPDSNNTLTFEMNSISLNQISISFEHPLLEQMCSVEIELGADPTCIQCHLYGTEQDALANDEYATRVLQRCLSIPVSMRAILRKVFFNKYFYNLN